MFNFFFDIIPQHLTDNELGRFEERQGVITAVFQNTASSSLVVRFMYIIAKCTRKSAIIHGCCEYGMSQDMITLLQGQMVVVITALLSQFMPITAGHFR